LLICRGEPKEKAGFLYDWITSAKSLAAKKEQNKGKPSDKVDWSDQRLSKAIKLMLYFSEVLPKKFMN